MPLKSFGNFYNKGALERSAGDIAELLDPQEFAYER
jgi:hypothetical protein